MATSLKSKRGAQPESGIKRAALYVRVSTGKQEEEGTSLGTQEAACRKYAAEQGYVVAEEHVYREVHTGTELWERPQLAKMREAVRVRDVDAVIAFAIDRLSRDPVHMGVVVSEAEHKGVGVEFVTEPMDGSPEGQLIRFVRGYAAKVEHEKIKERTIRGRLARAQAGKLIPGPRARYGYHWNEDRTRLLADDVTAPIVRRMFAAAGRGESVRAIANGLARDGIQRPSGADRDGQGATRWGEGTVWLILTNLLYAGEASAWAHSKTGPAVALPAGTVPALVARAEFDAIQERLRRNKAAASRNNRHPEETLLRGGYVRCGYCDCSLCVHRLPARGRYVAVVYRCSRSTTGRYSGECQHTITATIIDGAVWQRVEQLLTRPDLIAAELERMRANDPSTADLEAVERQLTQVVRQQRNLIENLANVNGAAGAVVTEKINALERQRDELSGARELVFARAQAWSTAQERLGAVQQWCSTVAANIRTLTYAEKRIALDALGVEVRVWRADHEPRYEIRASIPLDAPSTAIVSTTTASI